MILSAFQDFVDRMGERDAAFTGRATGGARRAASRAFKASAFHEIGGQPTRDRLPGIVEGVAIQACRIAGLDADGQALVIARAWAEGLIGPAIFDGPRDDDNQSQLVRLSGIYRREAGLKAWTEAHASVIAAFLERLPKWIGRQGATQGPCIQVELMGLAREPKGAIDCVQRQILSSPDAEMLGDLRDRVASMVERVTSNRSRAASDFASAAEPVTIGRHPSSNVRELADGYFAGTNIPALLRRPVPVTFDDEVRSRHTYIMGGSGSGKSRLIARQIINRLPAIAAGKASMVVIDPKCELIDLLLTLGCFDPAGALAKRTWLIDPSRPELTPRLSPWGLGGTKDDFNAAIDTFSYLIGEVGEAKIYARQKAIFGHFLRLMMVWPNADLDTLRRVLKQPALAMDHLDGLPPVTRAFFVDDAELDQTRDVCEQMRWRLDGLQAFGEFNRMLNNAEPSFNPTDVLDGGALVLARLPQKALSTDQQSTLGRALVAMASSVVANRYADGRGGDGLPGDVVIDECQMVFQGRDDSVARNFLATARGAGWGATLAHQNRGQLDDAIAKTLVGNAGTRIIGKCESKDARYFADNLNCEPSMFPGIDEGGGRHFVIQVNGRINDGTICHMPNDDFSDVGFLSADQRSEFMALMTSRFELAERRNPQADAIPNVIPMNREAVPL